MTSARTCLYWPNHSACVGIHFADVRENLSERWFHAPEYPDATSSEDFPRKMRETFVVERYHS